MRFIPRLVLSLCIVSLVGSYERLLAEEEEEHLLDGIWELDAGVLYLTIRSTSDVTFILDDPHTADKPLYSAERANHPGKERSYYPPVSLDSVDADLDAERQPVLNQTSIWIYPRSSGLKSSYKWSIELSDYAKRLLTSKPRGLFEMYLLGYKSTAADEGRLLLEPVKVRVQFNRAAPKE